MHSVDDPTKTIFTKEYQYTKQIDDGKLTRIYVNLDCPLVEQLSLLEGARQKQGVSMLTALAQLMSQPGQEESHRDLSQTLSLFCDTLRQLLQN